MTDRLTPPPVRPPIPPGVVPSERRTSWTALLDKPETLDDAGITGAGTLTGPLTLKAAGTPPLKLERTENAAAVLTVVEIKRDGATLGYVGLNADDHVAILAQDGTTEVAEFGTDQTAQAFAVQALRDVAAGGVTPFYAIKRQSTVIGYLGVDASDNMALIADDGATVLAWLTPSGDWQAAARVIATTTMKATAYHDSADVQVVTSQQGAVSDAATSAASGSSVAGGGIGHASADPVPKADYDTLVDRVNAIQLALNANATAINSLVATLNTNAGRFTTWLGRARTHGLIAP